jgi:archaetidylinositol phosphate synthase
MLFNFKQKIENGLEPIARHIPISPNIITIISILCMLFAAYFVTRYYFVYAGILVLVSGFLDILDGAVAKAQNRTTDFGNFFDKFADRVNDIIIISVIIAAGLIDAYFGLLVLAIILLASYASAVIESLTKTNIGSVMSMRGIRIFVIAFGLMLNGILIMMVLLFLLGILALGERLANAVKMLKTLEF